MYIFPKLKAFADNVTQMMDFLLWIENIVGKGENAGHLHFLLLPHYFH